MLVAVRGTASADLSCAAQRLQGALKERTAGLLFSVRHSKSYQGLHVEAFVPVGDEISP